MSGTFPASEISWEMSHVPWKQFHKLTIRRKRHLVCGGNVLIVNFEFEIQCVCAVNVCLLFVPVLRSSAQKWQETASTQHLWNISRPELGRCGLNHWTCSESEASRRFPDVPGDLSMWVTGRNPRGRTSDRFHSEDFLFCHDLLWKQTDFFFLFSSFYSKISWAAFEHRTQYELLLLNQNPVHNLK